MALVLRVPLWPPFASLPSARRRCHCVPPNASAAKEGGAAVVWFKRDLRIDDQPGLAAAVARHRTVVPFYVFDRRMLSGFSDEMLQQLLFAVEDLKKLLKGQGSDLLIGYGFAEDAIGKLVNEVRATHVFAEEEVEHNVRRVLDIVESSLSAMHFPWGSPEIVLWRTPFYDVMNLEELPISYNDFQKLRLSVTSPIDSQTLPILKMEQNRGSIPTFDELKMYMSKDYLRSNKGLSSLKKMSAKTILKQRLISQRNVKNNIVSSVDNSKRSNQKVSLISNNDQKPETRISVFASREGNQVRGGTEIVLNALAAYLRYLEGTARDDWQELHQKLLAAESRKGASFGVLFQSALYLGTISRRRVYYEAIKYERERNAGFLSPFGYSAPTVAAAVDTVCSMEWYWLLALRSQRCKELYPIRIWSWNGCLVQYTVAGDKGPGVLFVHGFGAFLEHFRANISCLADSGCCVWAVTLLGFGKSEKPNVPYAEILWAEFLRDFIVDVVGEPVHLVGNSIGGYFVATVAGLWPTVAKSVVLLNTAGSVVSGYSSIQLIEAGQTSGIAWLGSRLLLLYLRLTVGNILKKCYPTNSECADRWLINEMLRASYDPGVLIVLESVFNFNLSVPLNYLLDSFGGKVLIIQGMKDPISKSKSKLSMFREHCAGVTIRELDAGHCPHDEMPEEVNSMLGEWVRSFESNLH